MAWELYIYKGNNATQERGPGTMTREQYNTVQAIREAVYAWQAEDYNNRPIRTLGRIAGIAGRLGHNITISDLRMAQDYEDAH
jgi:hypothetical protein